VPLLALFQFDNTAVIVVVLEVGIEFTVDTVTRMNGQDQHCMSALFSPRVVSCSAQSKVTTRRETIRAQRYAWVLRPTQVWLRSIAMYVHDYDLVGFAVGFDLAMRLVTSSLQAWVRSD
jgi:hypothetical protein